MKTIKSSVTAQSLTSHNIAASMNATTDTGLQISQANKHNESYTLFNIFQDVKLTHFLESQEYKANEAGTLETDTEAI